MTTTWHRAFLEAQHEVVHDVLAQKPRAFDPMYSIKPRTITDPNEAIGEEIKAISLSVCKKVMDNFALRLTEVNGGHLEQMLRGTKEQADRYHVLALCLEYNKEVTSEFSFNLNGNLTRHWLDGV